ncbi:TonB-dependent receptor [Algoriphagus machipongonensis]|uniref:TonB-dependent receptor n=1 Tax=Algoriphagus machipongonensis TaxID=388413 RepID=A3HZ44_9BACT|nr:TonB-dependent receptor [Algoriphagus machipongonensis]EAZ80530.1 putative TonB-dependent receptor [Algoriphagus machipongonensis]
MNCRLLLFVSLFFLSTITVFAQSGSIQGVVTTSDLQPLEFVNVGLKGFAKGNTTDRKGFYTIKNIEPGTYTVFASFVGVEKQERTIQISAGETIDLDFTLPESSTELSEVIVTDLSSNRFYADSNFTVAKLPLTDLENPQVYNSISRKLLKEQVVTNMNDALKNATGITRLWESTGRGGDGAEYYSMRGFSVQPTMVNGMPSLNNGGLDPANIETVDVIKGPSGTLFGSSVISYGGLINITTKRPSDLFKGEVGFITGNNGLNRISGDVNVPLNENASMRVNTAYQQNNTFQDAGGKTSFFVAPSFKLQASERLSFLINTEFLNSNSVNAPMIFLNRSNPLTFDSIEPFERNYERSFTSDELSINNDSYAIQAQAFYKISNAWTSQTVVSRSSTKTAGYYHYLFDGSDGDSFYRYISDRNGQTLTTDIQQNFIGDFSIGSMKNKMIVGLDFYDQDIKNSSTGWVGNGVVTLSDGNDTGVLTQAGVDELLKDTFEGNTTAATRVLSAYVSDVLELTSQLSLMASVRVDNFKNESWGTDTEENTQTAVSPKFGIVYQPIKDKVSVFGNYMNGFTNIAPTTVSDADGTNSRFKVFDPERANQYEFGVKTNLLSDKITATASYYNIRVSNRVMTDPTNVNNSIQGGEVVSKGFELSVIASPVEGLNLVAGFSHNDAEVTKDYPESGYLGVRPEEAGPEDLFNFWASYNFYAGPLKGFGLGFGGNAASEYLTLNRDNIGSFALPSYQVFNASLSYTGSQYFLALKVNNLTDQKYYSGWSTVTPQNLRNVSLSLNYRF